MTALYPLQEQCLKIKGSMMFLYGAEEDSTGAVFEWLNKLNVAGSLVWVTEY